jgi:hypothetical protein
VIASLEQCLILADLKNGVFIETGNLTSANQVLYCRAILSGASKAYINDHCWYTVQAAHPSNILGRKTFIRVWDIHARSSRSSLPITMGNRAVVLESEKGAIVVRGAEISKPGEGQVLIKVHSSRSALDLRHTEG